MYGASGGPFSSHRWSRQPPRWRRPRLRHLRSDFWERQVCNIWGGSGGGVKRNEGVEDTDDADMEELLARSRERLIVDVRPLPEWRSKTEAAMRNDREMLCRELCLHLGVTPRELGAIWRGGGLEDKVRIFLREWRWMHRPLSIRAAVEMLDEHMASLYGRNSGARAASTPSRPLHLLLRVFGGDPPKGWPLIINCISSLIVHLCPCLSLSSHLSSIPSHLMERNRASGFSENLLPLEVTVNFNDECMFL